MARTGTPSVIALSRKICKLVAIYGVSDFQAKTSPAFKLALDALVVACHAFEAADNYPAEVDFVAPAGPEDPPPV